MLSNKKQQSPDISDKLGDVKQLTEVRDTEYLLYRLVPVG
jgi:hypothetical protein